MAVYPITCSGCGAVDALVWNTVGAVPPHGWQVIQHSEDDIDLACPECREPRPAPLERQGSPSSAESTEAILY